MDGTDRHAVQSSSIASRPSPPSSSLTEDSLSTQPASLKRSRNSTAVDASQPPPSKRIKSGPEEPALYSENVRRKLAATTRTGQACDRCKERKMKCDPDPVACQPCRLKQLPCYTTDRVTGQSRERGQSDRAETEMSYLRSQLAYYERRYGPVSGDMPPTPHSAVPSPANDRKPSLVKRASEGEAPCCPTSHIPSAKYVGWPIPDEQSTIHRGLVQGTQADLLDWGYMDSGAFECDIMREPADRETDYFNFSPGSMLRTINQQQKIPENQLALPPKGEALYLAEIFLTVLWGFIPMVHKPSFIDLVHRLYDAPHQVSLPEKIQVVQVLAVLNHQTAIRNHAQSDKINHSYRYLHYSLGYYPYLMQDTSLASMQALATMLLLMRNLPKPGHSWRLAQEILMKCIDLDYHRDPDRLSLAPQEDNALAKELRKRVFHSILAVCVATGCRLGRPAPWQFVQWDVPLPMAIKDSEISPEGLQPQRSGRCDFWPCLQLAKLLPLYTELYSHILSVRKPPDDYLRTVQALHAKIEAWRADWDQCTAMEDKTATGFIVSSLLIESWAAEFVLNLHHPTVCTSKQPEVLEENLDIAYKAAKKLMTNFHTLSKKYKAADFTWHSIVAYTLGFGLTLHYYKHKTQSMTQERFDAMRNELAGWLSLMAYADLVLRTGNVLVPKFKPLVEEVQKGVEPFVISSSTRLSASLARPPLSRSNSVVKQEPSPQALADNQTPPFSESTGINGYSNLSTPYPSTQQTPTTAPSYQQTSSLTSTPYPIYSPPTAQYPNLPTSLAPLPDEAASTSMPQYRSNFMYAQDQNMLFSPHIYTDATAVWPVIPEGSSY